MASASKVKDDWFVLKRQELRLEFLNTLTTKKSKNSHFTSLLRNGCTHWFSMSIENDYQNIFHRQSSCLLYIIYQINRHHIFHKLWVNI